jgi:hypothetical protein
LLRSAQKVTGAATVMTMTTTTMTPLRMAVTMMGKARGKARVSAIAKNVAVSPFPRGRAIRYSDVVAG